ncbi:hypothetical protein [Burkholderia sp. RF4-BP95]|uniref:hypothetical protein n=1 Tax=Burkholderia sp. RF4-BP95 TaxID=1637845 RepID=UPI0007579703|nr:hypothetical protein [Burkholderia sp. RF4-BP95]KUY84476.1 hypothetical protein WS46_10540 [Burkholderia sp. RF4-BP95]
MTAITTTEAVLHLSAGQHAVAQQKISDIFYAIGTVFTLIKEGRDIQLELATNCVKVAEFNLAGLCRAIGVETLSSSERAQHREDLRAANTRIRDLETQLGDTVSPEATQNSIKNIAQHLKSWWSRDGFGYVYDLEFGAYGVCHGKFSFRLNGDLSILDSDTPVSDKHDNAARIDSLRERGFDIVRDGREWAIADSDASRAALIDLFAKNIPSAKVFRIENVSRWHANGFVLRAAEVSIYKIAEIHELPIPDG